MYLNLCLAITLSKFNSYVIIRHCPVCWNTFLSHIKWMLYKHCTLHQSTNQNFMLVCLYENYKQTQKYFDDVACSHDFNKSYEFGKLNSNHFCWTTSFNHHFIAQDFYGHLNSMSRFSQKVWGLTLEMVSKQTNKQS